MLQQNTWVHMDSQERAREHRESEVRTRRSWLYKTVCGDLRDSRQLRESTWRTWGTSAMHGP